MKKTFGVLLAFVLAFGVMFAAYAEETPGSITINNTVSNKTYEIFKIFDLTYSGTGNNKKVSYTIDETWRGFFTSPAKGATYLLNANNGTETLNPLIDGEDVKYINITESNVATFAQDALDYAMKNNITPDTTASGTGNNVTVNNLDYGYYLVYPKGASVKLNGASSICSLDSTTPSMAVNIKADYPVITKTVDDDNVDVGQIVTFTVKGVVPDTTGFTSYTYKIDDTMTTGLTFNENIADMQIKFGTTTIDATPTYANNGYSLTFNMVNYQDYVGQEITITYKALVTEPDVVTGAHNSAVLTYSNDPKNPTNTVNNPPIEVEVHSSKVSITKVIKDTETPLADAKFVLKNSDGKYYKAYSAYTDSTTNTPITNTSTTAGVVKVVWVDNVADATVLVTDADGHAVFKGIENATYYLVETEAPEGYNKLNLPKELKVGYATEEGTNLVDYGVDKTVNVENTSGTLLPATGGLGTKLFIIFGTLVTLGSAVVLVTRYRMKKEAI